MSHVTLDELGLVCALGRTRREVLAALRSSLAPGMRQDSRLCMDGKPLFLGHVDASLNDITHLAKPLQSRNNQLILTALTEIRVAVDKAVARYGPARVGVVMGTSTSGVAETEAAFLEEKAGGEFPEFFHYGQMEIGSPSDLLVHELGVAGPAFTVSTACSSSAKALISARRLLRAGLCDAVIAGGADSLCRMTNAGFLALGAVSREPCRPFGKSRLGINIGEAAVLFLLTRDGAGPALCGVGESSDAHHISSPHPEGSGAIGAMRAALKDASLTPSDINYVNAHGTGTAQNDAMESRALHEVFGGAVPVSSTKSLSGHALGAAGALEAAFCWLLLTTNEGWLPPQLGGGDLDDSLPALNWVRASEPSGSLALHYVMSNSFGFGGNNTSIILSKRK